MRFPHAQYHVPWNCPCLASFRQPHCCGFTGATSMSFLRDISPMAIQINMENAVRKYSGLVRWQQQVLP